MIKDKRIKLNESMRVYYFNNTQPVVLVDVIELIVRLSGIHRLKTKDGKMHIIPHGWIHIEITSSEDWVV